MLAACQERGAPGPWWRSLHSSQLGISRWHKVPAEGQTRGHHPVSLPHPAEATGELAGPLTALPTQSSKDHPAPVERSVPQLGGFLQNLTHSCCPGAQICLLCLREPLLRFPPYEPHYKFSLGSASGPRKLQPQHEPPLDHQRHCSSAPSGHLVLHDLSLTSCSYFHSSLCECLELPYLLARLDPS